MKKIDPADYAETIVRAIPKGVLLTMKAVFMNGSPRKNRNAHKLLMKAERGVREADVLAVLGILQGGVRKSA